MKERYIPENVLQGKRILGFRLPNLIEGLVWALIAFIIIAQVPFVPKVRWIITGCVGLFLILVNGLGIKGQRFSQAFINWLQYRPYMIKIHYRRLNYAPDEHKQLFETSNGKTRVVTIHEQSTLGKIQRIYKH